MLGALTRVSCTWPVLATTTTMSLSLEIIHSVQRQRVETVYG